MINYNEFSLALVNVTVKDNVGGYS